MDFSYFDDFCGSPFWNSTLTWYTTDPELTLCFEKTILLIIPVLFLWTFSLLEFVYILNSKRRNVPWNWRNILKFFLLLILTGLAIADVSTVFLYKQKIYQVDLYNPLVKIVTYILTAFLLYYNKKYGMHTSGLLFLSWLLFVILGIPRFRTEIRRGENDQVSIEQLPSHYIYLISYPLNLLFFLLQCVADKPAKESKFVKSEKPCPEETASFLSKITYAWFDSLVIKGYKKPLEAADLWDMNPEDSSREVVPKFEKHWWNSLRKAHRKSGTEPAAKKVKSDLHSVEIINDSKRVGKKRHASILPAIFKTFGWTFLFATFLRVIQDVMTFINPQILGLLISFVAKRQETWKGYTYAFLLLMTAAVQTILANIYVKHVFTMGMNIRSALISIIYKKSLTISNSERRERTVGEIVNLMAVDSQKFMDLANHISMIWSAPLQICLSMYFLWQELGVSVLAGVGTMILLIPINFYISTKIKKMHIKQMKFKDARVKLMNEILNGMKVLKLYAWEKSFEKMVLKTRDKEIKVLKQASYMHAGTSFIWQCAPFIVSLMTFATYVLIDENNVLDANKAYVSLSLFNIMRMPMGMLPMLITQFVQTVVSVKRINKFLNADDLDPNSVHHEYNKDYPITVENGTFGWGEGAVLKDINLKLKTKTLTAIVGMVGSGKSTLLSALLGETEKINGKVNTYGTIAYVSQQAWIQNATLKDNILFGQKFNKKLYESVIEACALKPDLEMLPGGDATEIGEKGINLSGGQKQRVSLARAVYANADIYLMDDPLSAVDSHVGKHIFDQVIGPKGLLKNKTKVLVTHGITYLPQTDKICVLIDGEISESGSYKELLMKKGAFAEFLLQHIHEDDVDVEELNELKDQLQDTPLSEEIGRRLSRGISRTSEDSVPDIVRAGSLKRQISTSKQQSSLRVGDSKAPSRGGLHKRPPPPPQGGHRLIELEKAEKGKVSWDVYKHYLKALGILMMSVTFLFYMSNQGFSVGSNVWLGVWADDDQMIINGTVNKAKRDMYLGIYGLLGFGQVLSVIGGSLLFTKISLDAAVRIHKYLLENVLKLPMAFFDVTPLGRILGRFSNDINGVDQRLPGSISMILNQIVRVFGTLVVICFSTPLFISVVVPISIVYILMQRLFVATSRQLKRLESVSRSPIYSHFGETVTGVQVIRAYRQEERFIEENERKVDLNQVCNYPTVISGRWLSVRLEMMGNLIIFFAALFSVLRKDQAPAMVGLAITYSLQITQTLNWLVRMTSEIETNIVAVERIKEYGEAATEAPWHISDKKPKESWPEIGRVAFQNYSVRYRPGLDLVLKEINFLIQGGEKIGIVGRTGAGKSSLTLCLFRLIEAAQGVINIDDVNVGEIGLHDLRSRLTIIPQDAVLFSGTLRMNLDPFDAYKDDEVWKALEQAHLKPFVKGLAAGLQHEVSEGGENLSAGQRQLICLARALLRKTKILILDEATAAVDLETDDLIQNTIRSEFMDCTIITIAHRLNTIMDSDKVMVLDKGRIAEFDTPANLLNNVDSIFYSMHKDAGLS